MGGFGRFLRLLRNVGVLRGLGLACHRACARLFSPGSIPAWGDLGEDLLLWYLIREVLGIQGEGFYVDVGCNHPVRFNNTYRLYQAGWHGIAIDADADLTRHYARVRKRDTVLTSLVSDQPGELEFHVFAGTLVSSADPEQIEAWRKEGRTAIETRRLATRSLDSLLEEAGAPADFELLKIDVEGHDEAVLRSIDLAKYRPLMIVIEMHGVAIEAVTGSGIYQHLERFGYSMVSLAGYNGVFLKKGAGR